MNPNDFPALCPADSGDPSGLDWDYQRTATRRERFLSPALATFTAFERPLLLQHGQGAHVWDEQGRRYLDCLAQNLCISVGYNHAGVNRAIAAQLSAIQHVTTMYYHPAPAQFAEELVATMPSGHDWVVHLVNSGAEAIDLAVLIARLASGHHDLLTLRNSYHGMHFGAMAASGLALCRQPLAQPPGFVHVHNPDLYRGAYGDRPEAYLEDIDRVIDSSTSGRVAGMIVEPIQGYGGVIPVPPGYQRAAAERIRMAGGFYISDEVQTGFGRTGASFWAFEQDGVVPDAVVTSKGIGNGFPLAALIVKRELAQAMAVRKFFNTYGANPMACAAGRAVLQAIRDEDLIGNATRVGARFGEALEQAARNCPRIGQVRGRGLMRGIEFVHDPVSRQPADAMAARVQERLREAGVIVGRSGQHKNVLRINPPLCVNEADASHFSEALAGALEGL